jgi:hypothetical protein
MTDVESGTAPERVVRNLIAELAQVEDAIRRTPANDSSFLGGQANPELLELMAKEAEIVSRLRAATST